MLHFLGIGRPKPTVTFSNQPPNGIKPNRRRGPHRDKVFDYHRYFSDLMSAVSGSSAAPSGLDGYARQRDNGAPVSLAPEAPVARQASWLQRSSDIIADQQALIREQGRVIEQQSCVIEQQSRLIEEQSRLVAEKKRLPELQSQRKDSGLVALA